MIGKKKSGSRKSRKSVRLPPLSKQIVLRGGNTSVRWLPTGMYTVVSVTGALGTASCPSNAGKDGPPGTASFFDPWSIDIDSADNILIAERNTNFRLRIMSPAGNITTLIKTWGGNPVDSNGPLSSNPVMDYYSQVVVNKANDVFYFTEIGYHLVKSIIADSGKTFSGKDAPGFSAGTGKIFGGSNTSLDGDESTAKTSRPIAIAFDPRGTRAYIQEENSKYLRMVDITGPKTWYVSSLFKAPEVISNITVDNNGNVYFIIANQHAIWKYVPPAAGFRTTGTPNGSNLESLFTNATSGPKVFAGNATTSGYRDATGATALFNLPMGFCIDKDNNMYVADCNNNVIRYITPNGEVYTYAGAQSTDSNLDGVPDNGNGPHTTARFSSPTAVLIDSFNTLIVLDQGKNRTTARCRPYCRIRKIFRVPPLTVTNVETDRVTVSWPPASEWMPNSAPGSDNNTYSYIITPSDRDFEVSTDAINSPLTVTNLSDSTRYTIQIVISNENRTIKTVAVPFVTKIEPSIFSIKTPVSTTVSGQSSSVPHICTTVLEWSGAKGADEFAYSIEPADVYGRTTVTLPKRQNSSPYCISDLVESQSYTVSLIARILNAPGVNGGPPTTYSVTSPPSTFRTPDPRSMAIGTICGVVKEGGATTNATKTPIPASSATVLNPRGVVLDKHGNLYVTSNACILKIKPPTANVYVYMRGEVPSVFLPTPHTTSNSTVTIYAGRSVNTDGDQPMDATGDSIRFYNIAGMAYDPLEDAIYVSDSQLHIIIKLTSDSTGLVRSVVLGKYGGNSYLDGPVADARFNTPKGIAIGPDGSLFIADCYNHAVRRIYKGQVTTIAKGIIDGAAADNLLRDPYGIAALYDGTVYVTSTWRHCIKKLTPNPDGVTYTTTLYAGRDSTSGGDADGNLLDARFNKPQGLFVDVNNNIYVYDAGNYKIKLLSGGRSMTVFGGQGYQDGDKSVAKLKGASLRPAVQQDDFAGLTSDNNGNIYFTDWGNGLVRCAFPAPPPIIDKATYDAFWKDRNESAAVGQTTSSAIAIGASASRRQRASSSISYKESSALVQRQSSARSSSARQQEASSSIRQRDSSARAEEASRAIASSAVAQAVSAPRAQVASSAVAERASTAQASSALAQAVSAPRAQVASSAVAERASTAQASSALAQVASSAVAQEASTARASSAVAQVASSAVAQEVSSARASSAFQQRDSAAQRRAASSSVQQRDSSAQRQEASSSVQQRDSSAQQQAASSSVQQRDSSAQRQEASSSVQQRDSSAQRQGASSSVQQRDSSAQRQEASSSVQQRDSSAQRQEASSSVQQKDSSAQQQAASSSVQQRDSSAQQQRDSSAQRQEASSSVQQKDSSAQQQAASSSVQQRDSSAQQQRDSSAQRQDASSSVQQKDSSAQQQAASSSVQQRDSSAQQQRDSSAQRQEASSSVQQKDSSAQQQAASSSVQQRDSSAQQQAASSAQVSSAVAQVASSAVAQVASSAVAQGASTAQASSAVAQNASSAVAQDASSAVAQDASSAVAQKASSSLTKEASSALAEKASSAQASSAQQLEALVVPVSIKDSLVESIKYLQSDISLQLAVLYSRTESDSDKEAAKEFIIVNIPDLEKLWLDLSEISTRIFAIAPLYQDSTFQTRISDPYLESKHFSRMYDSMRKSHIITDSNGYIVSGAESPHDRTLNDSQGGGGIVSISGASTSVRILSTDVLLSGDLTLPNPSIWAAYFDTVARKYFYLNTITNEGQYEHPFMPVFSQNDLPIFDTTTSFLPAGWIKLKDSEKSLPYYFNVNSTEASWTHPAPPPNPNSSTLEADPTIFPSYRKYISTTPPTVGKAFYVNNATKEAQWNFPDSAFNVGPSTAQQASSALAQTISGARSSSATAQAASSAVAQRASSALAQTISGAQASSATAQAASSAVAQTASSAVAQTISGAQASSATAQVASSAVAQRTSSALAQRDSSAQQQAASSAMFQQIEAATVSYRYILITVLASRVASGPVAICGFFLNKTRVPVEWNSSAKASAVDPVSLTPISGNLGTTNGVPTPIVAPPTTTSEPPLPGLTMLPPPPPPEYYFSKGGAEPSEYGPITYGPVNKGYGNIFNKEFTTKVGPITPGTAILIDNTVPISFNAYYFGLESNPDMDMMRWTIQGSKDGSIFVMIDDKSAAPQTALVTNTRNTFIAPIELNVTMNLRASSAFRQMASSAVVQTTSSAVAQTTSSALAQRESSAQQQRDSSAQRQGASSSVQQRDSSAQQQAASSSVQQRDSSAQRQAASSSVQQRDSSAQQQAASSSFQQRDSSAQQQAASSSVQQRDSSAQRQEASSAQQQAASSSFQQRDSSAQQQAASSSVQQRDSSAQRQEASSAQQQAASSSFQQRDSSAQQQGASSSVQQRDSSAQQQAASSSIQQRDSSAQQEQQFASSAVQQKDSSAQQQAASSSVQQRDSSAQQQGASSSVQQEASSAQQQAASSSVQQRDSSAQQQAASSSVQQRDSSAQQQEASSAQQQAASSSVQQRDSSAQQQAASSSVQQRDSSAQQQEASSAQQQTASSSVQQRDSSAQQQAASSSVQQKDSSAQQQEASSAVQQRDSSAQQQAASSSVQQRDSSAQQQAASSSVQQRDSSAQQQAASSSVQQRDSSAQQQAASSAENIMTTSSAVAQKDSSAQEQDASSAQQQSASSAYYQNASSAIAENSLKGFVELKDVIKGDIEMLKGDINTIMAQVYSKTESATMNTLSSVREMIGELMSKQADLKTAGDNIMRFKSQYQDPTLQTPIRDNAITTPGVTKFFDKLRNTYVWLDANKKIIANPVTPMMRSYDSKMAGGSRSRTASRTPRAVRNH